MSAVKSANSAEPEPLSESLPKRSLEPGMNKDQQQMMILLFCTLLIGTLYRLIVLLTADIDLYSDEAYYWGWSLTPDWGYYSKPPMIAWLIALSTGIAGFSSTVTVKLAPLFIYPVTSLFIWAAAKSLFDARTAFYSAMLFFLLPAVSLSTLIISTDVPLFLFWAAALFALVKALQAGPGHWRWWLWAGLAGGLGLLSKYNMIVLPVATAIYFAVAAEHRHWLRRPQFYLTLVIAAVIFSPNLLWNAAHDWPTFQHTAELAEVAADSQLQLRPSKLLEFIADQLGVFGLVAFPILVKILFTPRCWQDAKLRLLLVLAASFLLIICFVALTAGAFANWAAPAYVSGSILVGWWLSQRQERLPSGGRSGWFMAILLSNLVLAGLLYHLRPVSQALAIELPKKLDVSARVRGWQALGSQARDYLAAHPEAIVLVTDRNLLAELDFYMRRENEQEPSWERAIWNADGRVVSHYHLEHALAALLSQPDRRQFLFISDRPVDSPVLSRFQLVQRLGQITVPVNFDYQRQHTVFLLQGFMGYPAAVPKQIP